MAHAAKYAASATGHMLSHYDRSKSHLGENIDPERTNLNYNLAPHREGGQLEFMHKRMAEVRCLKRADVNVLCDWVVTLPKYKPFRTDIHITPNKEAVERLFFERVYQFLCNRYGEKMWCLLSSIETKQHHTFILRFCPSPPIRSMEGKSCLQRKLLPGRT